MTPVLLADSRFLDGTPTATDTAAGYDVLNVRDLRVYTSWRAASAGTKYLTVDCGSPRTADSLAAIGHNFGTAAAAVSVESSPDNVAWTERFAPFTPANDRAFFKRFSTATARYWRLKLVTASVAPQLAVGLLGAAIAFPYPPEAPFVPRAVSVEADATRSKTGVLLGTITRYRSYRIEARWKNLPRAWLESYGDPFYYDHASNGRSFFWAWDLDAYPTAVDFVRLPDDYVYRPSISLLSYYEEFVLQMEGVTE